MNTTASKKYYDKMVDGGNVKLTIWVPCDTVEILRDGSQEDRRTIGVFISMILEDWADRYAAQK